MRPQTVSVKPTKGATRGGTAPEEAAGSSPRGQGAKDGKGKKTALAGSSATFLARTGLEPETCGL